MPELPTTLAGGSQKIRFVRFLINEKDWVQAGTPVAEVQTREAIIRVDANGRGVLLKQLAKPGKSMRKGDTIATIGADGEEIPYGKPLSLATVVREFRPPGAGRVGTVRGKFYLLSLLLLMALSVSWIGLNQLRRYFYLDSIEGAREASPYWTVVHVQEILVWPICVLILILLAIAIYEIARWLASLFKN